MPFVLIIIGVIVLISAVRGTHRDLGNLVRGDFSGESNFFVWLLALGIVGSIGYYQPARAASRAFMALIIISMLLSNRGFFDRLYETFGTVQGAASTGSGTLGNTVGNAPSQAPTSGGSSGEAGGSSGSDSGGLMGALSSGLGAVSRISSVVRGIGSFIGGLF